MFCHEFVQGTDGLRIEPFGQPLATYLPGLGRESFKYLGRARKRCIPTPFILHGIQYKRGDGVLPIRWKSSGLRLRPVEHFAHGRSFSFLYLGRGPLPWERSSALGETPLHHPADPCPAR